MKLIIIVVHALVTVLAYTAWFWLDWRILVVLAAAHLLMLEILQGCPLSHAQFPGDKSKRFYEWWMGKLGVQFTKTSRPKWRIFMQYILPLVIVCLAILLQVLIGFEPLIGA